MSRASSVSAAPARSPAVVPLGTTPKRPRPGDGGVMYNIRDGLSGGADALGAMRAALEAGRVPDIPAMPAATRHVPRRAHAALRDQCTVLRA